MPEEEPPLEDEGHPVQIQKLVLIPVHPNAWQIPRDKPQPEEPPEEELLLEEEPLEEELPEDEAEIGTQVPSFISRLFELKHLGVEPFKQIFI